MYVTSHNCIQFYLVNLINVQTVPVILYIYILYWLLL